MCVCVPEGLSWLQFRRVGSVLCFNSWLTMWVCRDTNTHILRNSKRILKDVGHILKTSASISSESNLQHQLPDQLCSCLQHQTYANTSHSHIFTCIRLLVFLILLLCHCLLYTHTDRRYITVFQTGAVQQRCVCDGVCMNDVKACFDVLCMRVSKMNSKQL